LGWWTNLSGWTLHPVTLGHAVEEVQAVKTKTLKAGKVAVRELEAMARQFKLGQQVVVEFGQVAGVHADGDGDVG
jgi:hypothetical protein